MGWKGALRSLEAAGRRAERDAIKRQRQLEKERAHYEKLEALDQARLEAEEYENYVERLISIHKDVTPDVDWKSIQGAGPPIEPTLTTNNEDRARKKLERYRPNFFVRLFESPEKKKAALGLELEDAVGQDHDQYTESMNNYKIDFDEWADQKKLAEQILAHDADAFVRAIEIVEPFSEIENIGSNIRFSMQDDGSVHCRIKVHAQDIIPEYSKSLLKSGKLSEKKLAKGVFFELYQDYVCGVVLRVANEIFSLLPTEEIIVSAIDSLLDKSTGHVVDVPIVSAFLPRKTLRNLNMMRVDPSDALNNFVHEMKFKKTSGFSKVNEVSRPN